MLAFGEEGARLEWESTKMGEFWMTRFCGMIEGLVRKRASLIARALVSYAKSIEPQCEGGFGLIHGKRLW